MTTIPVTPSSRDVSFFRKFFLLAALYDLVLGAAFFFLFRQIFDALGIELPNNTSYIHLSAGFVFVQGVSYWLVARRMFQNIDLVRVGIIYKGIFSLVAFYYLAIGQLLHPVFAWIAVCDVLFLVGFVRFVRVARPVARDAIAAD